MKHVIVSGPGRTRTSGQTAALPVRLPLQPFRQAGGDALPAVREPNHVYAASFSAAFLASSSRTSGSTFSPK